MANAVKSDKPPVMSQYGSRRSAINPLEAVVVAMQHFPLCNQLFQVVFQSYLRVSLYSFFAGYVKP
jgi:hypothetical protein